MPPSSTTENYIFCTKSAYVKGVKKNDVDDMTPNRLIVFLVFVSGIAVAVIGTLLTQYICGLSTDFTGMFIKLFIINKFNIKNSKLQKFFHSRISF